MRVEIIRGEKWYHRTRYKILDDLEIAGETIPAGFISDGASVPGFIFYLVPWLILFVLGFPFHWVFLLIGIFTNTYVPSIGRYAAAAFLHDYILSQSPRAVADRKFKIALKELSVTRWVRKLLYYGVRYYSLLLGAGSWIKMKLR